MTLVRLICPTGQARELAATGELVEHGATVEVAPELAGRPPTGTPGADDFDPGAGLLAQVDVWAAAQPAAAVPPASPAPTEGASA